MTAGTDWTEGSKTDQNLRQKLQRIQRTKILRQKLQRLQQDSETQSTRF